MTPAELARLAAAARRAREGLGYRHPSVRDRAAEVERGIGDVPALSDNKAELEGVPNDPVVRVGRPPHPLVTFGPFQLDADRVGGRLEPVRGEAERPSGNADVG